MKLKQFEKERDKIIEQVGFASIRTSPDFQCDQTDGVAYVQKHKGGASICYKYAQEKGIEILNIAEENT